MYDFHALMDFYEFQLMSCDILSLRDNQKYYCGPKSKDDSKDIFNEDYTIIGQVKNYKDNFTSLKNSLKKEIEKVKKLNPQKYIIVCANFLTDANKNILIDMFKPFLKKEDILDAYLLNDMLTKKEYEYINLKYLKLLVPNTYTLKHYLNITIHNEIYTSTDIMLNKMKNESSIFVLIDSFSKALDKLLKEKSIIIIGNPGVGKSILGRRLASYFINEFEDIEFYAVKTIEDLYKIFNREKKQVYFFDDFWGDDKYNYKIDHFKKRELIEFITNLKNFSDKYLIMTSREYVFEEGLEQNVLEERNFKKYSFLLKMEDFNMKNKFDILARHLEQNSQNYLLYKNILKSWKNIVEQPNYTPRLIETFFQNDKLTEDNVEFRLLDYLNQPYEYWSTIIYYMEDVVKYILFLLMFNDSSLEFDDLKVKLTEFLHINGLDNLFTENFWNKEISILEDNFVVTNMVEGKLIVSLKNPSYKDFLFYYFEKNYMLYAPLFVKYLKNGVSLSLLYKLYFTSKCNYKSLKEEIETALLDSLNTDENCMDIMIDILQIEGIDKDNKIVKYIYDYYKKILIDLDDILVFDEAPRFITFIRILNDFISLKEDASLIIDSYITFASEQYFDEIINWINLQNIFKEEMDKYVKENRAYVKDVICTCATSEAYYYLENNDTDIDFLYDEVIESFEKIHIKFPIALQKFLEGASNEIHEKNKGNLKTRNPIQKNTNDEDVEEMITKEIEQYIGKEEYVPIYEIDKYLQKEFNSSKEEINCIKKIYKNMYVNLLETKPSLSALIEFVRFKNYKTPKSLSKFLEEMTTYYFKKHNFSNDTILLYYLLASNMIKNNKRYYSLKEIEEFLELYSLDIDMNSFLSFELLERKGNWYCFINFWIMLHFILNWFKKYIYQENFEPLFYKIFKYTDESYLNREFISENELFLAVKEYLPDKWKKEIVKILFQDILTNINKKTPKTIVKTLLNQFDIEISQGFSGGYIYNGTLYIVYINIELGIDIFDFIDELDDSKYFQKYFEEKRTILFNDYLNDDKFYKELTNLGIDKTCLEIYKKLEHFIKEN